MSKLNDTSAWERRRVKGKVAVQKMVVDLMELYLNRLKQKRISYQKIPAMAEFVSQFPYDPTQHQKQVLRSSSLMSFSFVCSWFFCGYALCPTVFIKFFLIHRHMRIILIFSKYRKFCFLDFTVWSSRL